MNVVNENILAAGDASGNLTSAIVPLEYAFGYAIQAVFTGSPVGTAKLQGSCDYGSESTPYTGVVNWTDIAGSSQSVSAAGSIVWNDQGVFFKWLQVVYTATSGTGTMTVRVNTKGTGP